MPPGGLPLEESILVLHERDSVPTGSFYGSISNLVCVCVCVRLQMLDKTKCLKITRKTTR